MAIRFQYNKTSLQDLGKQLKVRQRALPTLQNKEAALRLEVARAREEAAELERKLAERLAALDRMARLWPEFDPSLLAVDGVELGVRKVAGVKIPLLAGVRFTARPLSLLAEPAWFPDGAALVRELVTVSMEREAALRRMRLLEHARKKTTQKVNLYEKVQIPGFQDAMRKIKRFLEDEENLSKAAQKIVKERQREDG